MRPNWFLFAITVVAFAGDGVALGRAATRPLSLAPAVGHAARYRISRTVQGNTGARVGTSVVTLRRKSASALTLAGVFDRPAEIVALTVSGDGVVQVPPAAKGARDDSSVTDIVDGANRVAKIFAGVGAAPRDGWSASVPVPEVRGATSPVSIPIAAENVRAGAFDFHGVGQIEIAAQAAPAAAGGPPQRGFGRRGPYGAPGAFAGGPLPGPVPNAPALAGSARPAVSVAVSVDGRVRHGELAKIAIVETRSTTVDGLPYVNVSGWTIEALK